jgi:glucose-6-phosphate 1-dehydrogenase
VPGPTLQLAPASAPIPLGTAYHTQSLPAYSRLIHDVLIGDRSLFTRPDGLAHVWKVASAVLENKPEPIVYPRGSWGPKEAADLIRPEVWLLGS